MAAKRDGLDAYIKAGALMLGGDTRLDMVRVSSGIPQLDRILQGGYVYGRNILCAGPESTGKTIIAQYAVAAQQQAGKECLLVDAEMSFDRSWWERTGVDTSKLWVAQPSNGEEAVNLMVEIIHSTPKLGIIVVDSLATLSPSAIQEKQAGERTVGSLAQLVTGMYQRVMPINKGRFVFFAINQLRDSIGGYEDVLPGGRAQRYNSHIRLHTRRVEWIKEKEVRVGYVMEIHLRKSKVGDPEGIIQFPVRFGSQIDLIGSYVDEAIERGFIKAAGPYYYISETVKVLGKSNLRAHFSENEADMATLMGLLGG